MDAGINETVSELINFKTLSEFNFKHNFFNTVEINCKISIKLQKRNIFCLPTFELDDADQAYILSNSTFAFDVKDGIYYLGFIGKLVSICIMVFKHRIDDQRVRRSKKAKKKVIHRITGTNWVPLFSVKLTQGKTKL